MAKKVKKEEDESYPDYMQRNFQEQMVVVSYHSWVVIITFSILMIGVIFWAFFGAISVQAVGRGIALTTQGVLGLPSKVKGRIIELNVKSGQLVKKGDKIAVLFNLDLEVELKNAIHRRDELESDYLFAKKITETEMERRNVALNRNIEAIIFELEERTKQLPFLEQDLSRKTELYGEGLISAGMLEQAQKMLIDQKIAIEDLHVKRKKADEELQKSYKLDELRNYERLYYEARNHVKELEAKASHFNVETPIDGKILELEVRLGEEVHEGQLLVLIEKPVEESAEKYAFYCYVPSHEGSKVMPGMTAFIDLSLVDSKKYGYLVGTVSQVSAYPVSDLHIYSVVNSHDVVKYLRSENPAVIEVVVNPQEADTPSGYLWTSKKGAPISLRSGLLGNVRLTVEERKPISYLIPTWWMSGTRTNEMNESAVKKN